MVDARRGNTDQDAQTTTRPTTDNGGTGDSGPTVDAGGGPKADSAVGADSAGQADAGNAHDADIDTGTGPDAGADTGPETGADTGATDGGSCVTVPPSNSCGLDPQCGCGANRTCDVTNDVSGATSCVSAGSNTLGAFCSSTANCGKGLTCVFGACRPYCSTPNQPCNGAGLGPCFDPQNTNGTTTPSRHVCAVMCDPRTPSTACVNNSCWYYGGGLTDCRPAGLGTQDATCSTVSDCAAGYECGESAFLGPICMRFCRLPLGSQDCGSLTTCTDFYGPDAPISGGVKLGLCD